MGMEMESCASAEVNESKEQRLEQRFEILTITLFSSPSQPLKIQKLIPSIRSLQVWINKLHLNPIHEPQPPPGM